MNWNYLDVEYGNYINKIIGLMFIFIILLINLTASITNPLIDSWGHFGGFVVGFFFLFLLADPEQENDGLCCGHYVWRIISYIVCGFVFIFGFILLLTTKKY